MTDADTYNLFEDSEFQPSTKPGSTVLVIRAKGGRALSKDQCSFNRLTKRIADLERKIATERDKLDLLLSRYHERIGPLVQAMAKRQLELARALGAAVGRLAPRKRQKESVRAMIVGLCGEAFCAAKPDAEAEALYDEWAQTSYREEIRQRSEELKENLAAELRFSYGIDADVSEDDDSPEGLARLLRRLEDQVRTAAATQPRGRSPRRKGPKHLAREEERQEREALTKKSVRGVYLSLAKVLHPDTVRDAAERALREEYMKQATLAYGQGDLAALLKLELRWVTRDDAGVNALSDDALRIYLPALKEQVAQLERALESQFLDPHYFPIAPIAPLAEKSASFHLGEWARDLETDITAIERELEFVKRCTSNSELAALARDYLRAQEIQRELEERVFGAEDWD